MKKNIASKKSVVLGLCLIFLFSFNLTAQSLTLESVCKSLASHPITTGDFTQIKTLQTNGRKLTSTGKFIFSQEGILWQTEKPFPSSLILTKEAMVQVAANGKKSVMSGKDNQIFANISDTLSSVFSGNVDALKKNFECELVQEAEICLLFSTRCNGRFQGSFQNQPVPSTAVPMAITAYTQKNYPSIAIIMIDKEDHGYEVELITGINLKFNEHGAIINKDIKR